MGDEDYVAPNIKIPRGFAEELRKLGPLLDLGAEAYGVGLEILRTRLTGRRLDSDYRVVAYLIFTKATKTFSSVLNLCMCGCGSDGLSLCASLFENHVDLTYIRKAPKLRARRFLQFEQVGKYYQVLAILGRKRLPKGMRRKYKRYEGRLAPEVKEYLKHFPRDSRGWSKKSLYKRAKEVKADLEYDSDYRILCAYKHTLPTAAGRFVITAGTVVDLIYGPNFKDVYTAALYSTKYFLRLCEVFQDTFLLNMRPEIAGLSARLATVARQLRDTHPELCQ